MSEFVAGAFVDVKPDTKGFREDLKRKVNASIKSAGTFKVPIELDPKRFKSTVNAAARQATARVPIEPSTSVAELRTKIKTKIDKATTGLKINVPIEIQQTGAGSRGGTSAAGSAAGAEGAAAAAATASTQKLTNAKQKMSAVDAALARNEKELAIAASLFAQSQAQGIKSEERATLLREARSASSRAAKAANDVLAVSEANLTAQQQQALLAARDRATSTRGLIVDQQKLAATEAAQTTLVGRNLKTQEVYNEQIAISIKEIKDLNTLRAVENDLSAVEARLKREITVARELEVTSIVEANTALLHNVELQQAAIVEQRAFLKGETLSARQQKTAARGFLATALSLIGVRGATLAASSAFLVGAVSAAVFAKSVKSFADFETELNVFQATAGATAEQMKAVAAEAEALGRDITLPGVTAGGAANAMTELARAGLSVRDSIAGARGVLQLAAAAQISNADAANLAASALNAFGLSGDKAIHVADLLANAANASQGSISEMAAALAQASAIARQVGLSLDNTVTILTQFARNGLRGSDAGTSLRTALSRLIAPTKQASSLIEALGLNLRDANGNIRADVFAQFGKATEDLTPALRDMIAETIAGQDAIRAFSIGAREGARGLRLAQLQMQATGSAAALAAARSKGLAGDFSALGSNVQTLGAQLGKFAAGPVAITVKGLTDIVTALGQIASGNFGDLFGDTSSDLEQAGRNLERKGKALLNILNPLETDRFAQFGKLFTNAPDPEAEKIKVLADALSRLQNLRVQTFQIGGDIGPITEQIKDLRRQLHDAKVDAADIIPLTPLEKALAPLQDAKETAKDLKEEILGSGGSPARVKFLDDLIRNFDVRMKLIRQNAKAATKDISNELSSGDIAKSFNAEFKLLAQAPELATPEVLASLDDLVRKIKGKAKLTGSAGREMGTQLIGNLNKAIAAAVEADNPDLAAKLKALATKIANLFGVSLADAFKNIKLPLTDEQLADALLPFQIKTSRAEAFGTVGQQIAGKQGELRQLEKQLNQVVKGSQQEKDTLDAISSKKEEIRSLREGQAQKDKEADQTADKKVLDAISSRERGLLNNLTIAQGNENLRNDIKAQLALRAFYQQQIAVVKATVRDKDTRNDQLDELNQKLFELDQDIQKNREGRRDQIRQRSIDKLDAADEKAQETETLKDDLRNARRRVRFWKRQVANLKQLVAQRRASADELKKARDALDDAEDKARQALKSRREQIRDTKQQSLELDIDFAQTTGNANAEVRARQRFIAFLEGQKKFFKGNTIKLKELRNEIASQKKAIKDAKGELDKDKGTTIFEFLQEAAQTFQANAGNLITPNQPFAGSTAFTGFIGDITNFIKRSSRDALSGGTGAIKRGAKKPLIGVEDVVDPGAFDTLARLGSEIKRLFTVGHPKGLIEAGNIDLLHRKVARNPDGSISTVKSFSVSTDKGETLLPQVINGKVVSQKAAIEHFRKTGENLGTFRTIAAANAYAKILHEQQAKFYAQWQRQMQSTGGMGTLAMPTVDTNTTAVDRNRASVERLTGSVDRLITVLSRQPGEGRASTAPKKTPAGIERTERNHFATATAARRVVENRVGTA